MRLNLWKRAEQQNPMRVPTLSFISSFLQRSSLRRWDKLSETAKTAPLDELRGIRGMARAMRQRVNTVNHSADARLTRPDIGSGGMALPPGTDWSHRPDVWSGPISPSGYAPAKKQSPIGGDLTLYHDCKSPSVSVRQIRNTHAEDLAPFGLQLDVFDFDGSFLSLVAEAPDAVISGLRKQHVLRLILKASSERPLDLTARLNLKNGPNTEQISREIKLAPDTTVCEFDLAYVPFNESRAEQIWFDLFFESPSMNQVIFRDLTLSRHKRADL